MVTEATFFMLAGAKFGFRTSIKCIKWGLGRFYHFFTILPFLGPTVSFGSLGHWVILGIMKPKYMLNDLVILLFS